jgi:hypothetical protein
MSTSRFGQSLPGPVAYEYFGFTVGGIAERLGGYVETVRREPQAMMEFYEFTEADGVGSVRIH